MPEAPIIIETSSRSISEKIKKVWRRAVAMRAVWRAVAARAVAVRAVAVQAVLLSFAQFQL